MLHISICDDEIVAVEKMRKIVGKVLEQEQLLANVGTFENGEEFLNQYIIRDDELVILDLDMPIKSGIDVIQELEKIQRNEVVILVTAYDNLAIQSFSYGPFQIIRKERLEEDLPKAVSRFLKMRQRKQEVLGVFYLICWTMQLRRVRKIKKKRESFARLPEKRTR